MSAPRPSGNALFPAGRTTPRQLSRAYAVAMYRGNRRDVPRYVPLTSRRGSFVCDECAARQHETRGQLTEGGGVRAAAKCRRVFPGDGDGTALLLCREHEQLWRERDTADGVPAGRAR